MLFLPRACGRAQSPSPSSHGPLLEVLEVEGEGEGEVLPAGSSSVPLPPELWVGEGARCHRFPAFPPFLLSPFSFPPFLLSSFPAFALPACVLLATAPPLFALVPRRPLYEVRGNFSRAVSV